MDKDKKKRLKKEQEERRKLNKENKVVHVVSYEDYLQQILAKDIASEDWLMIENRTKKQIEYVLNHWQTFDIMTMEQKLSEALIALTKCCEELYSPLITKNKALQEKACQTIINYYRSSFEIRFSGEISLLPLEVRLFIYVEMLKRESSKYNIVNILDRIVITLNKMGVGKEYDAAIFVLTWAEMILFATTDATKYYENFHYSFFTKLTGNAFTELLLRNYVSFNPMRKLREQILEQELSTALDKISEEFWYGSGIFSKKEKLSNMEAAVMCLELFRLYFERVFPFAEEFKTHVLDYYETGKNDKLLRFFKEHKNERTELDKLRTIYTDPEILLESEENKRDYPVLMAGSNAKMSKINLIKIPTVISQEEYDVLINEFFKVIEECEAVSITDLETYLVKLSTGMLLSTDWDENLKKVILHNIYVLKGHLWENANLFTLRTSVQECFKRALLLETHKSMAHVGDGATITLIYAEDGPVVFHSDRNDLSLVTSTRFLFGCKQEHVIEAFSNLREYIVNAEFHKVNLLPQNMVLPGWNLFETTLEKEEREQRYTGWVRLGVQKEKKLALRNADIEAYIFSINLHVDEKYSRNDTYDVIAADKFEQDMETGVIAYRNRKYVKAAKEFIGLLEKYPEEGRLYYYIANTFSYMIEGREYSLRFFEKALEYIDYVEVWVDYGNILWNLRRVEKAIEVLEQARIKFYEDGSPSMILSHIYKDKALNQIVKSEAVRKRSANYNEIIHEWESKHQLLKPIEEDYI